MSYLDFMNNERYRWSYMDEKKLQTRLKRITRQDKLEAFLRVALERENKTLIVAADTRGKVLGFVRLAFPGWAMRLVDL